jgi:hypothetical protein
MKKLLVASAHTLIAGLGLILIGFTVAGTFSRAGMVTEFMFLSLGSLITCFSIAIIPSALSSLDEKK